MSALLIVLIIFAGTVTLAGGCGYAAYRAWNELFPQSSEVIASLKKKENWTDSKFLIKIAGTVFFAFVGLYVLCLGVKLVIVILPLALGFMKVVK